jgi:multidrug resistance efflux pump
LGCDGNALVTESTLRVRQSEHLPPLDIQIQEAKVRTLEAELETAQKDMECLRNLNSKNAVAQQEVDRQRLVLRRSQGTYWPAPASLSPRMVAVARFILGEPQAEHQ